MLMIFAGVEPTLASSTSYADPQSLDPSLLNQSVPAVYNRFQTSQFEIMRKKAETEQQFGSFLAQYSGLSNNSVSPGLRSPLSGPAAGPFASVHAGYNEQSAMVQPGYLPRPLPYVSPTQPRFPHWKHTLPRISPLDRPRSIASSFPVGPEASRYPVSALFRDNGGFDMPHTPNDPSGMTDMYPSRTRSDPQALTLDTSGASAQIVKPKKKVSVSGSHQSNSFELTNWTESFQSQACGTERKGLVLRGYKECESADLTHIGRGRASG